MAIGVDPPIDGKERLDDIEQRLWSMYEELEERLLRHDRRIDALGPGPASTFIEPPAPVTRELVGTTTPPVDSGSLAPNGEVAADLARIRDWVTALAAQTQNHAQHIARMSQRLRLGESAAGETTADPLTALAAALDIQTEHLNRLQEQITKFEQSGAGMPPMPIGESSASTLSHTLDRMKGQIRSVRGHLRPLLSRLRRTASRMTGRRR